MISNPTPSKTYICVVNPSANRVYNTAAADLLAAELRIWLADVCHTTGEVELAEHAGMNICKLTCRELTDRDQAWLGNFSGILATFEDVSTHDQTRWTPLNTPSADCLDSDILTIQKYVGKTNEQFTKLLLNTTIFATAEPDELFTRPLRVLDPMCGRGTTLNQAAMYGCDAFGVDIDKKAIEHHRTFFVRWLKDKRCKHRIDKNTLRVDGVATSRHDIIYATDKTSYKNDDVRQITTIQADTHTVDRHFRKNWFDVIVADTPYGIQHGSSQGNDKQRRPQDLIATAVPRWATVLKPGGALGLAINTALCPREDVEELLEDAGLNVQVGGGYEQCEHRVDRVITRDIVIATKE